jgi:hypothetical protein
MNDFKAMAERLAPKMELTGIRPNPERKAGRGFVVQEPLKEESTIAFVSNKNMGKVNSNTIASTGISAGKIVTFEPSPISTGGAFSQQNREIISAKVQLVQTPIESNKRVVQAKPVIRESQQTPAVNQKPILRTMKDDNTLTISTLNKSISKVSNLIKDWLYTEYAFNKVNDDLRNKMMDTNVFYNKIQNAIYHSLREFCHITKGENNYDILPKIVPGVNLDCFSTLVFFDRIFNDKTVSYEKLPSKVMERYRNVYGDADGIQEEWIEVFKNKLRNKMIFSNDKGIDEIAKLIMREWTSTDLKYPTTNHGIPVITAVQNSNRSHVNLSTIPINLGEKEVGNAFPADLETIKVFKDLEKATEELENNCGCGHEHEEEEDEDEDEEEECSYLRISIFKEETFDIVKFESSDGYGKIAVPFYTNLDNVLQSDNISSIADDRNGKWDWLIHFAPDLMFTTKTPERYLAGNDDEDEGEETRTKCVIMDEYDGTYIIGVYCIESITIYNEDSEVEDYSDETIIMLNNLVNQEIASGYMSHLNRSLSDPSFFKDEEYVLTNIFGTDEDDDDDEDEDDDEEDIEEVIDIASAAMNSEDLVTRAAIESMNGNYISMDEQAASVELDHEEDHEMDSSVVSIGGKSFDDDNKDFSFQPIRTRQKFQD